MSIAPTLTKRSADDESLRVFEAPEVRRPSSTRASRRSIDIFFLTFKWTDSIYESRCDFFEDRKFELGESIDEERNQEGCREKEGCSEKKEVVRQRPQGR
jgi:hypothetical protein